MMTITDQVTGQTIPRVAAGLPVECESCGRDLDKGQTVTLYASDRDYGPAERDDSFTIDRVYGLECCERTAIKFPCDEAVEVLFAATIDDGWMLRDVKLADKSLSGEGVPWDPDRRFRSVSTMTRAGRQAGC